MIRHLVKLMWNRKRSNALLIAEVFGSFLVVFAVATLGLFFFSNYRRPLGFEWRDAWSVEVDFPQESFAEFDPKDVELFSRLVAEARTVPEIRGAIALDDPPFSFGSRRNSFEVEGRSIEFEFDEVDERAASLLGLRLVAGRWFGPEDAALAHRSVVIDRDLAHQAFGDENPIGRRLVPPEEGEPEQRVVGVITSYRTNGELARGKPFAFLYRPLGDVRYRPASHLLVKVPPGATAVLEERLIRRLRAVAPSWRFEVERLTDLRDMNFRLRLLPLVVGGVISFFLLLMVGLGLLGVLWQNVLRRTRELGLRRAVGAPRSRVHAQVIGEQVLLTTFGVLLGLVVVAQLPLFGLSQFVGRGVFVGAIAVAISTLYLLALACALYPSVLAGRVPPAEALRYE